MMHSEQDLVSVVIPTYNRAEYLKDTIDSVLKQTYPATEVIIIDDGSEDECKKRIRELAALDPKVSSFRFSGNNGIAAARNEGARRSRGKYVIYMDDDDLLHPQMIERCIKSFENPLIDVVICKSDIIQNTHGDKRKMIYKRQRIIQTNKRLKWINNPGRKLEFFTFYFPRNHSIIYRKELLLDNPVPVNLTYGCHQDNFLWLLLCKAGAHFDSVDFIGAFYRVHDQRPTSSIKSLGKSEIFIQEASVIFQNSKDQMLLQRFYTTELKTFGAIGFFGYWKRIMNTPFLSLRLGWAHQQNLLLTWWKLRFGA